MYQLVQQNAAEQWEVNINREEKNQKVRRDKFKIKERKLLTP